MLICMYAFIMFIYYIYWYGSVYYRDNKIHLKNEWYHIVLHINFVLIYFYIVRIKLSFPEPLLMN